MSSDAEMFAQRGFAVGMGIALVFFLGVASFWKPRFERTPRW